MGTRFLWVASSQTQGLVCPLACSAGRRVRSQDKQRLPRAQGGQLSFWPWSVPPRNRYCKAHQPCRPASELSEAVLRGVSSPGVQLTLSEAGLTLAQAPACWKDSSFVVLSQQTRHQTPWAAARLLQPLAAVMEVWAWECGQVQLVWLGAVGLSLRPGFISSARHRGLGPESAFCTGSDPDGAAPLGGLG